MCEMRDIDACDDTHPDDEGGNCAHRMRVRQMVQIASVIELCVCVCVRMCVCMCVCSEVWEESRKCGTCVWKCEKEVASAGLHTLHVWYSRRVYVKW